MLSQNAQDFCYCLKQQSYRQNSQIMITQQYGLGRFSCMPLCIQYKCAQHLNYFLAANPRTARPCCCCHPHTYIHINIFYIEMGNKQPSCPQPQQQTTPNSKLVKYLPVAPPTAEEPLHQQPQHPSLDIVQLEQFCCMDAGLSLSRRAGDFQVQLRDGVVLVTKHFGDLDNLQAYFSNAIKISKMLELVLYDELNCTTEEGKITATISLEAPGFQFLNYDYLKTDMSRKMDLLIFVAGLLRKVSRIYITPEYLGVGSNSFYLLNFQHSSQRTSQQLFLGFLRWAFGQNSNFQICLCSENLPAGLPIYIQQIYSQMHQTKTLTLKQLEQQLRTVKDKMAFLMNKTDSFYACHFFKKFAKQGSSVDWIFLKQRHELFFYHIPDRHVCNGKLIRKKKKINIQDSHVTFDHQQLQLLYVPENSKFMVRACEFQFESSSSISDIEIKHKLPVKFKNCLISRAPNGDTYLLEQNLYRFTPKQNKLVQETKKMTDYIFLASTRQCEYFVVKLSIDIFRNGIRVFYRNEDLILSHTGDEKTIQEILSIRIDIRHVVFCTEVYKGVFLMMAAKNIWILDINFECFFSFATPTQIRKLGAISKNPNEGRNNDQTFQILNQPFRVNFQSYNDGGNAVVINNMLHLLLTVQDQPYYLKYSFIHRIGALKLEGYLPLFVQSPYHPISSHQAETQTQEYQFNFHEENSGSYKYRNWIFKGDMLVRVYDFRLRWEKTNYEVTLSIQKISETLKEYIEKLNKSQKKLSRVEMLFLLYKLFSIFEYLFNNSISHKNISVNHICFTQDRQIKIFGWTEPSRNWHVSDYKDFLLTCFNVITYGCHEKISDKVIAKHEVELSQFPVLSDKIQQAFKLAKMIQRKAEIQKNLQVLKSYLEKELAAVMQKTKTSKFIFSFQFKTPRMSVMNTQTQKMKKVAIVPEESQAQEFTFNESDQYAWNQETSALFVFTAAHQFYEIKINLQNPAEQKIVPEDYEFLPFNISFSTFIYVKGGCLFSFGGVKREQQGKSLYSSKIYKFNWKTLTWDAIADMPEPRISPHAVLSSCGRYIYLVGGPKQHEVTHMQLMKYDILKNECSLYADRSSPNLLSSINCHKLLRIFHLSEQLCLFMLWYVEEGDYVVRYVSYLSSGFDIEIRLKAFVTEAHLARESISLDENNVHILRPYGKYTKLTVQKLECLSLKNETIYAI